MEVILTLPGLILLDALRRENGRGQLRFEKLFAAISIVPLTIAWFERRCQCEGFCKVVGRVENWRKGSEAGPAPPGELCGIPLRSLRSKAFCEKLLTAKSAKTGAKFAK
jgi:hypothetical protein